VPQAPQCAGFELVSTHWPPQFVVPPVQFSVHTPLAQTWPEPQVVPQPPQLFGSVCVFRHCVPHFVKPLLQMSWHEPLAHEFTPFGGSAQETPQVPQFVSLVCVFTHWLPHFVNPLLQLKPHTPPLQVRVPFAGASGQLVVQFPQCDGSDDVATHCPLQLVVPVGQFTVHVPFEHTCPPGHALPQLPQLLLSVCLLTQTPLQRSGGELHV
jgi:hypothetical protein